MTATYQNREGDVWELREVEPHPVAPLALVLATRAHDGQRVCVARNRLKAINELTTDGESAGGTETASGGNGS